MARRFQARCQELEEANSALRAQNQAQAREIGATKAEAARLSELSGVETEKNELEMRLRARSPLASKSKAVADENEELKLTVSRLQNELAAVGLERDSANEQTETALTQLQADRSSFNQSKAMVEEVTARAERVEDSLSEAQEVIAARQKETTDLQAERERWIEQLSEKSALLDESELAVRQLNEAREREPST
jgi:chromosome segregation ATPase